LNSSAAISQNGNDNLALYPPDPGTQQVNTMGAHAQVNQFGDGNAGSVAQFNTYEHNGYVWQSGIGNFARTYQENGGAGSTGAGVQQFGDYNTGYASQLASLYSTGWVTQSGNNNVAYLMQDDLFGSVGFVEQTGTGNYGTLYQTGIGMNAEILQGAGAWCTNPPGCTESTLYTGPGNWNQASASQLGANHVLAIGQFADLNYVSSFQSGNWTAARIGQFGNDNEAYVNQYGTGAMPEDRVRLGLYQRGEGAYASVLQSGSGELMVVNQNGGPNEIGALQNGAFHTAIVTQTSPAGIAFADRNIMNLSQVGSGHYANVGQNGMRNVGSITQY
jgi:hypothetical protein